MRSLYEAESESSRDAESSRHYSASRTMRSKFLVCTSNTQLLLFRSRMSPKSLICSEMGLLKVIVLGGSIAGFLLGDGVWLEVDH